MRTPNPKQWLSMAALIAVVLWNDAAGAFCGFYVAGADAKLFNNATLVAIMREGNRTVLSMQNNYQGPPENFAMVVPVPVVLQKENVKTLTPAIFTRLDSLAAPRLVEYWEMDPCKVLPPDEQAPGKGSTRYRFDGDPSAEDKVKVEAQFTVGEYEVVILSTSDAAALEAWLRDNKYEIPEGAEPYLKPYVAEGSKFFVAKVDVSKVKMEKGMAMLSPLRFHYDDEKFRLPVRLGLINSAGTQDLIVHILARARYDVANYPNVTIPTNIDVDEGARAKFGEFYAALFDRTIEKNRGAVITEYSWSAVGCDPCPTPPLEEAEVDTLGGDVIEGLEHHEVVLTRLHARYDKAALGEDLVFRKADGITGGREFRSDGKLETGAIKTEGQSQFQGRYAIRHPWTGKIDCANPVRGRWGGPPEGQQAPGTKAALDLAFAPRGGVQLAKLVKEDVTEIDLKADAPSVDPATAPKPKPKTPDPAPASPTPPASGCGCAVEPASNPLAWTSLLLAALLLRRTRSRGHR